MTSLAGVPALPMYSTGFGIHTGYGTLLPPGSKVAAFVRSTGPQDNDDPFIAKNLVTTLDAGLARARSGLGDVVAVLPGHSEDLTTADAMASLKAGTKIIGLSAGGLMPTLRWAATAATFLLDVDGVVLQGLRLRMEGANGVVAPITVTGADCAIVGCDIETASGASNVATTVITVSTGANRFTMAGCRVRGTGATSTSGIVVSAAVDSLTIVDCRMIFPVTAATGLINFTAAATNVALERLTLMNTVTNSTSTLNVATATAVTGIYTNILSGTLNTGGTEAATQGITFPGSPSATVRCVQCFDSSDVRANGILNPAAST